jgi:hypothetical protein
MKGIKIERNAVESRPSFVCVEKMDLIFISILIVALFLLHKWLTSHDGQFEEQGIAFDKPLPVIGNFWPLITKKEGIAHFLERYYDKFEHEK